MKYLKLFENWLNEADGGGAKPFDANNPGATLVVDITQKDMLNLTKDYDKLGDCLSSFLNKGFLKKDPLGAGEYKVSVTKCEIIESKGGKDSYGNSIHKVFLKYTGSSSSFIDLGFKDEKNQFILNIDSDFQKLIDHFDSLKASKIPVYLVTLNGSKVKIFGEFGDHLILKDGACILMPKRGEFWEDTFKNEKDFAFNSEINLLYSKKHSGVEGGLGDLMPQIEKLMTNYGSIFQTHTEDKWTPQIIAKQLGYEIPDNYAPGQGVEKKKA